MNGNSRRAIVALLLSLGFFVWAIQNAMSQRHRARQFTQQLDQLQEQSRTLKDEHRSLLLEYMTITGYAQLRDAVDMIGMREPKVGDGSMIFIAAEEVR